MKKLIYTILIITFTGLLGQFIWKIETEDPITSGEIHALIEQGETQIDLTKLTDLEWTDVRAFGPYTTDEMIEDSMGVKFLFGGIDVMETNFLLVFANDKKVVKTVSISRKYGDYSIKDNKFLIVENVNN
ncbi:hypothetical protein CSE16_05515 [Solibacillus sp. R5-41]|uniref:hypothetical protein n=1 Tax=Solibacillus sp. R5-41 TaxID=2048654 RepID=UPI000C125AAC|nr:hypothetical protein [Solibacillus sp. R5-41]ATP39550.1 hypothetical protein CSE16_05515 [Solibacillus sp. R5-41]